MGKISKFFKKHFGKDLGCWEEVKYPLYTIGSPEPRCFRRIVKYHDIGKAHKEWDKNHAYTSFSGVDVKAYFDDEQVGILQGISFGYFGNHDVPISDRGVGGTCIFIMFDGNDHHKWLGKKVHLALVAANEYGKIATVYNAKVEFDEHEEFGISIDDIVVEVSLSFTLIERYFTDYKKPEVPVCVS